MAFVGLHAGIFFTMEVLGFLRLASLDSWPLSLQPLESQTFPKVQFNSGSWSGFTPN